MDRIHFYSICLFLTNFKGPDLIAEQNLREIKPIATALFATNNKYLDAFWWGPNFPNQVCTLLDNSLF
jgi:hypothetical protein